MRLEEEMMEWREKWKKVNRLAAGVMREGDSEAASVESGKKKGHTMDKPVREWDGSKRGEGERKRGGGEEYKGMLLLSIMGLGLGASVVRRASYGPCLDR